MKNLIALLLLFSSFNSVAGDIIASYDFGHRIQSLKPFDEQPARIYHVTVDSHGVVEVSYTLAVHNIVAQEPTLVASKKLNQTNFSDLRARLIGLANAELDISVSQFVCEIFVSLEMYTNHLAVGKSYDYQANQFDTQLRVVDGPKGCFVMHHVSPSNRMNQDNALVVKSLLRALALETL